MDRRQRVRQEHRLSRKPRSAAGNNIAGKLVASGEHADVWLFGEALEEYEALLRRTDATSRKSAAQIPRYFGRFAQGQPLGDQMFKPLGRFKTGSGKEVQVHEFKSYQFRIYGVIRQHGGKRSYVGTACDPSKKKDKADPAKMKKAAEASEEVS